MRIRLAGILETKGEKPCLPIRTTGTITPWATGFRSPSSFGFNLDGDLFYSENQGDWVGSGGITFQPAAHVIMIKLLAPEKSGRRLAHDIFSIRIDDIRNYRAVELLGFRAPLIKSPFEISIERLAARW